MGTIKISEENIHPVADKLRFRVLTRGINFVSFVDWWDQLQFYYTPEGINNRLWTRGTKTQGEIHFVCGIVGRGTWDKSQFISNST